MAFTSTDVTTGLEELISKCEFENKQYVRAISQETQLLENIDHELVYKNDEMVQVQTLMAQTEKEMGYFERQSENQIINIESMRKTSDILTEHIHAMRAKFDDIKAKRHEEKCGHEEQLQHFRDKWKEYKVTYESFPLAIKLRKIQDEIKCSKERIKRAEEEEQMMKERIKTVDNIKYWRSMEWKEFCIKLAENRLSAAKMRNEILRIENEKKELEKRKNQATVEVTAQSQDVSHESNIQKMTGLHLPEDNQRKEMECSPMISVLSDRDDEQRELMQTDEGQMDKNIVGTEQPGNVIQDEQYRMIQNQNAEMPNSYNNNFVLNQLFPQPKHDDQQLRVQDNLQCRPTEDSGGDQRQVTKMQTSPSLPFVSYTKHDNGTTEERVNLHLSRNANKPFPAHLQQKSYSQPPPVSKINQPNIQQYSNNRQSQQNIQAPTLQQNIQVPTPQLNIRAPTPQLHSMPSAPTPQPYSRPSKPIQAPAVNTRRAPAPVQVPTLTHRMPSLAPNVRGSRSLNFQPRMPVLNTPGHVSRSPASSTNMSVPNMSAVSSVPRSSLSVPSLGQPSVQNRSYVQQPNMPPKIESRTQKTTVHVPQYKPPSSINQTKHGPVAIVPATQIYTGNMTTTNKPETLKDQTSKVVQSLQQQPSRCPRPVSQTVSQTDDNNNQVDSTVNIQTDLPVTSVTNQEIMSQDGTSAVSQSQNMLESNIVYHEPLKNSPERHGESMIQNSKSPAGKKILSKNNSPFNMAKHRQKLEELKKSPAGYHQYVAERRMFQPEISSDSMHAGGDNTATQSPINTAVFGGASQPADDKTYTATPAASEANFNMFTSFMDTPGPGGAHFMSFGQDSRPPSSPGFILNFGEETQQSPGVDLSFLEKRNNNTAASPNFNFNFDRMESGSNNDNNTMSLFGDNDNAGKNGNESGDFFKLDFSKYDGKDSAGGFFSFENTSGGQDKPFSLFGSPGVGLGKEKPTFLFGGPDKPQGDGNADDNFTLKFDQSEKDGDSMLRSLFGSPGSPPAEAGKEKPMFLLNMQEKENEVEQDFSFFSNFQNNKNDGGSFSLFGNSNKQENKAE